MLNSFAELDRDSQGTNRNVEKIVGFYKIIENASLTSKILDEDKQKRYLVLLKDLSDFREMAVLDPKQDRIMNQDATYLKIIKKIGQDLEIISEDKIKTYLYLNNLDYFCKEILVCEETVKKGGLYSEENKRERNQHKRLIRAGVSVLFDNLNKILEEYNPSEDISVLKNRLKSAYKTVSHTLSSEKEVGAAELTLIK